VYPRDAARWGRELLFDALSGRVEHASGEVDADVVPSGKGGMMCTASPPEPQPRYTRVSAGLRPSGSRIFSSIRPTVSKGRRQVPIATSGEVARMRAS
jgi:hypothetical protein